MRRDCRERAVRPRDHRPHRDQREHVEVARQDRLVGAHDEGPAGPQHDRRGEDELQPVRPRLTDEIQAEHMLPHFQHEHGNGQRERDPEPPRHIGELRIGTAVGGHHVRLKRHAADRATPRPGLPHLRMHRAGVDRAVRHRLRRSLGAEEFLGLGGEPGAAPGGTEEMRLALVRVPMRRHLGVDRHSANGIDHPAGGGCGGVMRLRHDRQRSRLSKQTLR